MNNEENASTKFEISNKSESALREEAILKFWQENKIFEKTLSSSKGKKGRYVFYEGPPTANGKPGIHHLEARAFKDVIPRYKTMQGFHVARKGGWDTHGLPVELQVEKELGLTSKKEIEEYGIGPFNQKCKESVWNYLEYWNKFTERIGFWVDQENPYVTYHNKYIESVWNVIKEANKQGLLYKDYKVVPWCPRCGTGLSSHELAQGYETVKDLSVYVKFKVKNQESVFILAWTTTPWTLPGNVALAIGEEIIYIKIKKENEFYILAKERISVLDGEYEIIEEFKGKDLIGLEYEPLYLFTQNLISGLEKEKLVNAYKIYNADFVTTQDGTGVVHTAVMYGQDDFVLGNKINLPKHHLVGLDGKFFTGTGFLEKRFVRDEEVAVDIIKDLAARNLLLKKEKYEHAYPHCWRCKTALIYYARDSWYLKMTSLRNQMVKENKEINWEPDHIKEGRFGEWLREIKDWAISRERYWGTPLPIWHCDKCNKVEVFNGIADLKSKTKKSGNKYFIMRHGEAQSNLTFKISSKKDDLDNLTTLGKKQVLEATKKLKDLNIDLIFASDFVRTKETAEIVLKELNLSEDQIIFDSRLWELNAGNYQGKKWAEYPNFFENAQEKAESLLDVKKRISEFLYDIEKKYQNKNILIISHESVARLSFSTDYLDFNFKNILDYRKKFPVFQNAEVRKLDFIPMPHDNNFNLDLHKPYIDQISLICDHSTSSGQTCGGKLERTKEVMDVWFDSGAMPFAQDHYPFENKDLIDSGKGYPADFISEAIDQTRGWFYTLHAVGSIMGKGKAYKNVICLGHLLDASGKKMSKSLGNVVDPWVMIDKYGVDTLRLWMYSVNQPGESKNFDEKTVSELHNKIFNLLYNVLAFYELYRDPSLENSNHEPKNNLNVLDIWILNRFKELNILCTEKLNNYKLIEPVRAIREFIDDLSTWYLRRSRERIKEEASQSASAQSYGEARKTLYYVLKNLAKLMAPFAPFSAEDIWQKLKNNQDEQSIHLATWPKMSKGIFDRVFGGKNDKKIINEMEKIRKIVTLGLQSRQKAGIPVRQPLNELKVKSIKLSEEYLELIQDELNVKEIVFDQNLSEEIELNLEITEELKKEGCYREFVRAVQGLRKKANLNPSDEIVLEIETDKTGEELLKKFEINLIKTVNAKNINFSENNGEEIKIDNLFFKISIKK